MKPLIGGAILEASFTLNDVAFDVWLILMPQRQFVHRFGGFRSKRAGMQLPDVLPQIGFPLVGFIAIGTHLCLAALSVFSLNLLEGSARLRVNHIACHRIQGGQQGRTDGSSVGGDGRHFSVLSRLGTGQRAFFLANRCGCG